MDFSDLTFKPGSVFLVTGGAGFIGSNLCEAILRMGCRVKCMDDFSTGRTENIEPFKKHEAFILLEGDIRDYETCFSACKGVDYVLHQAAWGSVPRSIKMPLLYEQINISGSLNMLEASRQNNVKKFVYASSSSVYGDTNIFPQKEGNEGKVLSPYALTKRVVEEYARLYTKLYGLDTYGLRYFNVFGRRQNPEGDYAAVIPKFINLLMNGKKATIYGDGMQSRDFTYIDNVIDANLRACMAGTNAAGECFNIACGDTISLLQVYRTICDLLDIEREPLFAEKRAGDIILSNADISRARKKLGYHTKYDFYTGLKCAVEYYRQAARCSQTQEKNFKA